MFHLYNSDAFHLNAFLSSNIMNCLQHASLSACFSVMTRGLAFVSLCVDDVLTGICGLLGRMFGSAGRSASLSLCRWVIMKKVFKCSIPIEATFLLDVASAEAISEF